MTMTLLRSCKSATKGKFEGTAKHLLMMKNVTINGAVMALIAADPNALWDKDTEELSQHPNKVVQGLTPNISHASI